MARLPRWAASSPWTPVLQSQQNWDRPEETDLPNLASLLLKIPDEFKPLAAIAIGSLVLVGEVIFHGIGLHLIIVPFKRGEMRLRLGRPHLLRAAFLFGWAVFQMLFLHLLEIACWAFALLRMGLILRPADALYFCANSYTTLGFGSLDLGRAWRNIAPIIAISGLFTFAWTASSLVNIVGSYIKLVEQLLSERQQEREMRASARHAQGAVFSSEKEAEQAQRLEARKLAQGASFLRWREIWKQERRQAKQMRAAAKVEAMNIRARERLKEEDLGRNAQNDSEVKR